MIAELEVVESIRKNGWEEVRARVCDAGNGPMVDVRTFVLVSEYDRAPEYQQAAHRSRKLKRPLSTYTGRTKEGVWLTINQALALAEAIVKAAIRAEELGGDPDGMPEHLRRVTA